MNAHTRAGRHRLGTFALALALVAPALGCPLPAAARIANLVVLNLASYRQAPDRAVWGITFDVPPNQLVSFDGIHIGPQ